MRKFAVVVGLVSISAFAQDAQPISETALSPWRLWLHGGYRSPIDVLAQVEDNGVILGSAESSYKWGSVAGAEIQYSIPGSVSALGLMVEHFYVPAPSKSGHKGHTLVHALLTTEFRSRGSFAVFAGGGIGLGFVTLANEATSATIDDVVVNMEPSTTYFVSMLRAGLEFQLFSGVLGSVFAAYAPIAPTFQTSIVSSEGAGNVDGTMHAGLWSFALRLGFDL